MIRYDGFVMLSYVLGVEDEVHPDIEPEQLQRACTNRVEDDDTRDRMHDQNLAHAALLQTGL